MRIDSRCAGALLAVAVLLAGCGGTSDSKPDAGESKVQWPPASSAASPVGYNGADVMFAQMMVPHHGQGIEIVQFALDKAVSAEVKTLAAAIKATQTTEANTMSGWLRTWGQPATAAANEHAAHGGMPRTSPEGIASLKKSTGAEFDRVFLNTMIAHQDDAIQMARSEAASGEHAQATDLAKRIDQSRTAQISQMLKLLGQG